MKKPISAIKFKNYCINKNLRAKDIAEILHLQTASIYKYWAGDVVVPDDNKKLLEQTIGLQIYDVFFNDSFDKEFELVEKIK